ncbi:MAG TPA: 3-dehydroquinate synthase [Planctomycetia bacterium]|nr:3-dehydroquinate synthase [Planctomycetia bacterium]
MLRETPVALQERGYQVVVADSGFAELGARLRALVKGTRSLVVADENVARAGHAAAVEKQLSEAGFHSKLHTLPPGEGTKTLPFAERLWDALVAMPADRRTLVVAVGGGVISDLAGFVAATYARGVPFAIVPTTLLAMVDASVGGKVAIDHPGAKNIIGCFHQPRLVYCNLETLSTLPQREVRCGLAEAVKHAFILDPEYLDMIERDAGKLLAGDRAALAEHVSRNCAIKARVVTADEREETGIRAMLNFGHTFGHAFETAGGYRELQHGEAVSVGMICAARLAVKLGRVGDDYLDRLRTLLERLGLPTRAPAELLECDLVSLMRVDKKASGGAIRFVLPSAVGRVELVEGVDERLVRTVLAEATN